MFKLLQRYFDFAAYEIKLVKIANYLEIRMRDYKLVYVIVHFRALEYCLYDKIFAHYWAWKFKQLRDLQQLANLALPKVATSW